ncbi:MAG TPA: hypothetical protein VMA34_19540 [Terracidiphilus sp.]|nr:hypothetical protein [Terracidiphilus sp.]
MNVWKYHVEVIPLEFGQQGAWSIKDSPYGETKLTEKLNDFGRWGWELISIFPIPSETGQPLFPPKLYAVFRQDDSETRVGVVPIS